MYDWFSHSGATDRYHDNKAARYVPFLHCFPVSREILTLNSNAALLMKPTVSYEGTTRRPNARLLQGFSSLLWPSVKLSHILCLTCYAKVDVKETGRANTDRREKSRNRKRRLTIEKRRTAAEKKVDTKTYIRMHRQEAIPILFRHAKISYSQRCCASPG